MYSKAEQLKANKSKKDLTDTEKVEYFTWIKKNKGCIIEKKNDIRNHSTLKTNVFLEIKVYYLIKKIFIISVNQVRQILI